MIIFTAPLQMWSNDEGRAHFMTVPIKHADEIRAHCLAIVRGFKSSRVEVTIGDVTWRTSVFPQKSGSYFLPVKMDVCRKTGIATGDDVTVELELL
jgi:hypothetical protein